MNNIILVAQPRSGGVFTMNTIAKYYTCDPLYEYLNTHSYGYDTSLYSNEMDCKIDRINVFSQSENKIIKVSWWDIKDVQHYLIPLNNVRWFHLERTDPVEMVISSYFSYLTGVFHKNKNENFTPVSGVEIPKSFVDDFFSCHNGGGWHFNLAKNIPIFQSVEYTQLYYNDKVSETDIISNIDSFHNDKIKSNETIKLYPNKKENIINYEDVKRWIAELNQ